ncbi:WD40 repeat-like protein [Piedraia hortae CBS 480.64]|uniref:WD40 repeat-like protein n=1 Tax=Piedraia hortae CBS 480.64 TaxID=1314780 RepID=A0A6A7C087_9PEZI|nr:WD40 repeat-like protein [Piedraia hortae CBS 480.64]
MVPRVSLDHPTNQGLETPPPPPPPHSTVASFDFGPAIQTMVTTVTRTTTTRFPPIALRPPGDLHERDPRHYPLAFTPTPSPLKKFAFEYRGRPMSFYEADDPNGAVRKYHETRKRIQRNNGSVTSQRQRETVNTPTRIEKTKRADTPTSGVKRMAATSVSVHGTAELMDRDRKAKKLRARFEKTESEESDVQPLSQTTTNMGLSPSDRASPTTPAAIAGAANLSPASTAAARQRRPSVVGGGDEDDMHMMDVEQRDETRIPAFRSSVQMFADDGPASCTAGAVATPPLQDADREPIAGPRPSMRSPRPPHIVTDAPLDGSLPSPGLSPILAAVIAPKQHNAFDDSFGEDDASVTSRVDLADDRAATDTVPRAAVAGVGTQSASQRELTFQDIPAMLDAFDNMPQDMKSWLVYQFLRRCSKTTLHVVANVVNPALKCDPFAFLPPELGLSIVRFLDAKTMCRAAQVSKRWRRLINGNETAWRDLLERDGFVLPFNEVARAVKEGWGWQHPGLHEHEQDLSKMLATSPASGDDQPGSSIVSRLRRKATSKYTSSKKTKRRSVQASPSKAPTPAWKRLLMAAQGPHAIAQVAMEAVPEDSQCEAMGLPSLRSMHLFKSLYQRHYLMRKAWMQDDFQPRHLAFRAHHRNVVTCLLFDENRILTGSDDTKINVYDTKTGALRNRLEGHEGGVWALQYEGNTLVSGSTDRSVRVWDINSGRCLQVFQGHTSTVRCLVILKPVCIGFEADGTRIMMPKEPLIITGSRDSTLRVWKLPRPGDRQIHQAGPLANDRDNPYFVRTLSGHHNSVRAIAAHGDTLVSGSYDCTVRVWKISTGELSHRLHGHAQKVYSVVLDHERNRCFSGSMDNTVKGWDLRTGLCLFNLEGHSSLVGLLDLGHNCLVSAAADSTLRIWNPETGACRATLSAHTGAITCFQHDGQKVISGSDRTLKMWSVRTGECVRDLLTGLSGVWQVRFDERRCVAAVQRNNLTYIEVLDFGASRDGASADQLGRRIVVDPNGREIEDAEVTNGD